MIDPLAPVVPPGSLRTLPQPEFALSGGMRLRPWTPSDAPALAEACLDPEIRHWNRPGQLTEPEAVDRIARWEARRQAEAAVVWAIAPATGDPAADCAVATKAGYPLECTMRGALLHADGWHDEHLHARLRTDAPAHEAAVTPPG
ncbi:GNAT family N-acetyltransferase [Streptomyces subrutilus]|uniref:N-acetyltransferase domain-containing protein n=1 Tax=Streptomyces subrutilus TaxID=36818 RepID=A0A1E5PU72_9ACTN|nr:GNAT family N-acetyltransferase [Streptomyces subrutilus]OEJ33089.1 hypothetical protein BGK67_18760 [Streptomyces subrutilus]